MSTDDGACTLSHGFSLTADGGKHSAIVVYGHITLRLPPSLYPCTGGAKEEFRTCCWR